MQKCLSILVRCVRSSVTKVFAKSRVAWRKSLILLAATISLSMAGCAQVESDETSGSGDDENSEMELTPSQHLQKAREALSRGDTNDFFLRLNLARAYFHAEMYEEALKAYLWCFDDAPKIATNYSSPVRDSYVVIELAALANTYESARKALTERRELVRTKILDSELTKGLTEEQLYEQVSEFSSLNRQTDNSNEVISLFRELDAEDNDRSNLLKALISQNIDLFVKNQLFEEIDKHFNVFDRAKFQVSMLNLSLKFPLPPGIDTPSEQILSASKSNGLRSVGLWYSVLLATDRTENAEFIANEVIDLIDDADAYFYLATGGLNSTKPTDANVRQARMAIELDPSQAHHVDVLARLLFVTGEPNEAVDIAEEYLTRDLTDDERQRIENTLKAIR